MPANRTEAVADSGLEASRRWGPHLPWMAALGVTLILLGVLFWDALVELERLWSRREEYSHGYLIPPIALFLIWQNRQELAAIELSGSWLGWAVLLGGLVMFFMGDLGTLYVIQHYAVVVTLFGVAWAFAGTPAMRYLWIPLAFLLFMVPLPPFLYNNLSQKLQLISSALGVAVIDWFGISVYLEGNVIDLGTYQLQVVEACDGLRYLFPLMSFGFLAAYMFHAPFWQRAVVFLSTIPITVLMNSLRIGVIGVLVENYGIEQAEGFLHMFEGWVIFMACVGILLLEMLLLMRVTGDRRPFREVFGLELPAGGEGGRVRARLSGPFVASMGLVVAAAIGAFFMGQRAEAMPERREFVYFPLELGEWQGRPDRLEEKYLKVLDLTDYIIADFRNPGGDYVNFYIAYYGSQRSGDAAHSPRACIPGGGWEIQRHRAIDLEGLLPGGRDLKVNRLQIQKGDNRQLVSYWFKQRHREIASEYAVKWFLFWDALTRNRTDGALIRLTTVLPPGQEWAEADARLLDFAKDVVPKMGAYIPD